ncbi:MAG: repressor LexA [Magnetococcales bacterium]|nr:repressor LexA [Magnetococcales bacterium]
MVNRGPKPTKGLTPAQERLVQAIRLLSKKTALFPTIQELADHLNIRGPSVHEQIKKLRKKGVLTQSDNKARSVRLIPPHTATAVSRPERSGSVLSVQAATTTSVYPIPLYGSTVPAGFPSPADDYVEGHLDLNQHLIDHPAATFFVRVEGSSMTGAGIHHGNILVVDRSLEAKDGDIVVAVVYGELTVKRLQHTNKKVWLIPENPQYTPLEITEEMEVTIWGVVTSAVHQFRR